MRKAFLVPLIFIPFFIQAQNQKEYHENQLTGHIALPAPEKPSSNLINELKVPENFSVNVFAENLGNARMLAVGDDGTIYLTARKDGKVYSLRDTNGDGKADDRKEIASDIKDVHGIKIFNNQLYLCSPTELWVADIGQNGQVSNLKKVLDNLPDGGQHPNRTLGFGPDNKLYVSVGSTCNACDEPNDEHATILQMNTDGSGRKIYAEGLRNTIGFAWHPVTNQLWGMDHGSDWRGDTIPPEELNHIREGKNYGWPFVYGNRKIDPFISAEPEDMTREQFARQSEPPVLTYTAHTAPIGMIFYTGNSFPAEYRNDAFVAFRGSWNKKPPAGYKISRIRFDDRGQPVEFIDFVSGFLTEDGKKHYGRLAGIAQATDGSLLFTDDENGIIYRVSYMAR